MLQVVLIAGANGSGKTTFARQFLPVFHPGVSFLNADEIRLEAPALTNPVAASRQLLLRMDALERARRSFAVETTLASKAYASRLRRWHAAGYSSRLHFIEVPSADFAVSRVRNRVAAGGHDIPEPDIRRRFQRGKLLFSAVYKPLVSSWCHWFSDANGLRLVSRSQDP